MFLTSLGNPVMEFQRGFSLRLIGKCITLKSKIAVISEDRNGLKNMLLSNKHIVRYNGNQFSKIVRGAFFE